MDIYISITLHVDCPYISITRPLDTQIRFHDQAIKIMRIMVNDNSLSMSAGRIYQYF